MEPAERAENRSNSWVAREYEIALLHELSKAQHVELTRAFAAQIANRHGVAVDFAIHAPHQPPSANLPNRFHAQHPSSLHTAGKTVKSMGWSILDADSTPNLVRIARRFTKPFATNPKPNAALPPSGTW